jgi:TIGR03009 family protein
MESTQMKTWNRWIGYCTLAFIFSSSGASLLGQQGYNTSGARPGNANPNQASPQQPGATGTIPVSTNNGANPNTPNPVYNPGLQRPAPATPAANVDPVVTKDPYADRPLTPQETAYLDQLLSFWEQSTKNLERLSCEFRRYEYNSNANFVQQLAQQTGLKVTDIKTTVSAGVIRYMKPDKGMYRIDAMVALTGKLDAKNQPEMLASDSLFGDYWICDGATVHNYDRKEKKVTHFTIPKEMQGIGILESPMPFLFGVEAKKLKERYWLRALPPPTKPDGTPNNDLFVIEAYPKTQQDAVNYDHVLVYLDREQFLPVHLIKFNPDHVDEPGKPLVDSREHYEFTTREKNASAWQKLGEAIFLKEFIPLKLPAGWTEETREYVPPGMENNLQANNGMQPGVPGGVPVGAPAGGAAPIGQPTGAPGFTPGTVPNAANRPADNSLRSR